LEEGKHEDEPELEMVGWTGPDNVGNFGTLQAACVELA